MTAIQKYIKKPKPVQAAKLSKENFLEVANWCGGMVVEEIDPIDPKITYVALNVPTVRGPQRVSEGDYVAKSETGQFDCAPAAQFEMTYEVFE